ncbi:hypothetical protein Tco_0563376 [Tanacetum coccineum]
MIENSTLEAVILKQDPKGDIGHEIYERNVFLPAAQDRSAGNKEQNFYEFYGDKRHNTDDCIHLKKQIKEVVKSGKLAHLMKEIKQSNATSSMGKTTKNISSGKEKGVAIFMMVGQPDTPSPSVEGVRVAIHLEYPKQSVMIGGGLSEEGRRAMHEVLRANLDIFAWKPSDMTGVPRTLAGHKLVVKEGIEPIRQMKRVLSPERNKAINDEVQKLVEVGIMREVMYHIFINPVLVKKCDGRCA